MAIIYTYPIKSIPNTNDLVLISDSEDSNNTKQVKVSTLPGSVGAGVSSVTSSNAAITIADSTSTPVLTSTAYTGVANIGHVPTGGSATTFLRGDGDWIVPTNNTYDVMGSGNSYAAGLVLAGNATHNNNYLRKDGSWNLPINTTYTGSSGVTLTGTDFTNTDKGSLQFIFKNIAVSGQSNVVAESNNDTLTLVGGGNTTLTTNAATDTVTITSSGGGSSGHTVIDMADADTDTNGFVNNTFLMTTTVDSTFTASSIKFQYKSLPASVSNLTVGIYTYVEQGINSATANVLLGQGSVGTNPTTKRVSIALTAEGGQNLNLTAGTNYVIAWKQVGGNAGSAVLAASGKLSDVNLAATINGNPALPVNLVTSGEGSNVFTATTLRPALTIY